MLAMKLRISIRLWLALFISLVPTIVTNEMADAAPSTPYQTSLTRWRAAAGQFAEWQRAGVTVAVDGTLQLDPKTAQPGTDPYRPSAYNGHNFYNGGTFLVGEATSPVVSTSFAFTQAIPSWNAGTPAGTWLETQLRARIGQRWTKWYNLGVWAADSSTVERHSVEDQKDSDGSVSTDTLVLGNGTSLSAGAFQVKVRLFSNAGVSAPSLSGVSVVVSTTPERPAALSPGHSHLWGKTINVPECSQMVYPDGGEVWCSPTSVSMVLSYWKADGVACEARVRASVSGVYDWVYDGHGNWPFNAAYAATHGLESYVARFTGLADAESWIALGVPVVFSLGWGRGELTGAPVSTSNGHLALLVGFDAEGNPVVNDPAAPSNSDVRRTYKRVELERLWLEHSGGTVYLIYPPTWLPVRQVQRIGPNSLLAM
jgi:hypothetical protein